MKLTSPHTPLEEDLCWPVPQVSPKNQLVKGLNWSAVYPWKPSLCWNCLQATHLPYLSIHQRPVTSSNMLQSISNSVVIYKQREVTDPPCMGRELSCWHQGTCSQLDRLCSWTVHSWAGTFRLDSLLQTRLPPHRSVPAGRGNLRWHWSVWQWCCRLCRRSWKETGKQDFY